MIYIYSDLKTITALWINVEINPLIKRKFQRTKGTNPSFGCLVTPTDNVSVWRNRQWNTKCGSWKDDRVEDNPILILGAYNCTICQTTNKCWSHHRQNLTRNHGTCTSINIIFHDLHQSNTPMDLRIYYLHVQVHWNMFQYKEQEWIPAILIIDWNEREIKIMILVA